MHPHDYTPDAVCRLLGVGSFMEPLEQEARRSLRLLFWPSFYPELCVTLRDDVGGVTASVAVARTQIWGLPKPGMVTVDRCEVRLGEDSFDEIAARFRAALREPVKDFVIADGMPIHFGLRDGAGSMAFSNNPWRDSALGRFAAQIIRAVFEATAHVRCRNGLARAGEYVGLDLPVLAGPDLPPVTKVAVLGVPEEQEQVLKALATVAAR